MSHECHNLQTAIPEPAVVDALLEKEVAKGLMIGPFVASPFSPYRVSPIGVATRKYFDKNFAMRIVPQGRSFVYSLLDVAKSVPHLRDSVVLDDGCRFSVFGVCCAVCSISFFYYPEVSYKTMQMHLKSYSGAEKHLIRKPISDQ